MSQRTQCVIARVLTSCFVVGAGALAMDCQASPYVVGGATESIISDSGDWAWNGSYLTGLRGALQDPTNFGPTGVVNRTIQTTDLSAVNAATLSGVNMFVGTWISDAQAAPMDAAVMSFFLGGGDLFLLQDDSGHDALGDSLGISTTASTGTPSNGGAPLFDGAFGVAHDVQQFYLTGQLDGSAIAAHNGHIGGTNTNGQITSAFWSAGEYAPGAGALFIVADIDMIATTTGCGLPICGGSYAPLNDNGVYALNTFSFLETNSGTTPPLPEPETYALMAAGFAALTFVARRRRGR